MACWILLFGSWWLCCTSSSSLSWGVQRPSQPHSAISMARFWFFWHLALWYHHPTHFYDSTLLSTFFSSMCDMAPLPNDSSSLPKSQSKYPPSWKVSSLCLNLPADYTLFGVGVEVENRCQVQYSFLWLLSPVLLCQRMLFGFYSLPYNKCRYTFSQGCPMSHHQMVVSDLSCVWAQFRVWYLASMLLAVLTRTHGSLVPHILAYYAFIKLSTNHTSQCVPTISAHTRLSQSAF